MKVAHDLGINYRALCNWIRQAIDKPKPFIANAQPCSKQDYQAKVC